MQINARLHGCIHKACAAPGIHRHHTNDHPIRYNLHSFTECHSNSLFLVTCPYLARKLHKYRPSRGYTGIDNVYATYVSVLGTRSRHGGSSKANGSPQVFRNRSPLESILNSHTQPDSSSTTITMTTTSHRETEKSSTHTQSIILRTSCTRIHLSMHVHEDTYLLHTPVYLHAD